MQTPHIDICNIPIYWVTHEQALERHSKIQTMFEKIGAKNTIKVTGPTLDRNNTSIAQIQLERSHLIALSHARALLHQGPVLVIEDDCWITKDFVAQIESYPNDADALYLGNSHYGMVNGVSRSKGVQFDVFNDKWDRIYNMLSIHAVLYLSESYKITTINNLLTAKSKYKICDQTIAMDMHNHKIYSYANPMFFQDVSENIEVTGRPLRAL